MVSSSGILSAHSTRTDSDGSRGVETSKHKACSPDIGVTLAIEELRHGRDSQLDAATATAEAG